MVVRHVSLVDKHVVINAFQIVLTIVTDSTPLEWHFTVSANQVAMAFGTIHTPLVSQVVIEHYASSEVVLLLRNLVTPRAGTQALVQVDILKVTEIARAGRHRHM